MVKIHSQVNGWGALLRFGIAGAISLVVVAGIFFLGLSTMRYSYAPLLYPPRHWL